MPSRVSSLAVGSLRYACEPNPDLRGGATSCLSHAENFVKTGDGVYNFLQLTSRATHVGDLFHQTLGMGPSQTLQNISSSCGDAVDAMAVVRFPLVLREVIGAVKELKAPIEPPTSLDGRVNHPATADQMRRRIQNVVGGSADAVGTLCDAVGPFIAGSERASAWVQPIKNVGTVFSLIADTADAAKVAEDWNRSRVIVDSLTNSDPSRAASAAVVQPFLATQKYSLLRLVGLVLRVVGGIFAVGFLLMKTVFLPPLVLAVIALTSSIFTVWSMLYKQKMASLPIEPSHYYNPALALAVNRSSRRAVS